MRKLWLLSFFILASASVGLAQGADDYNKLEVYVGYSLARVESNITKASFTGTTANNFTIGFGIVIH
jgi:hypothetical protein